MVYFQYLRAWEEAIPKIQRTDMVTESAGSSPGADTGITTQW